MLLQKILFAAWVLFFFFGGYYLVQGTICSPDVVGQWLCRVLP